MAKTKNIKFVEDELNWMGAALMTSIDCHWEKYKNVVSTEMLDCLSNEFNILKKIISEAVKK